MNETILEIKNLQKHFIVDGDKVLKAVDGVSFKLKKGETLGLVGESGCGKTTCGRTILGLYDLTGGEIFFKGKKINDIKGEERNISRSICLP